MTAKFTKSKRVVQGIRANRATTTREYRTNPKLPSFGSGGSGSITVEKCVLHGKKKVEGCVYCAAVVVSRCLHRGVTVGDARKDKTHAYNCTSCGLAFDGFLSDGRVIVKGGTR